LKLNCDEPLSNFAFKFNLRRYTTDGAPVVVPRSGGTFRFNVTAAGIGGRGLHSFTLELNLSNARTRS
jgi:hypothetical protein